jgi:hypothetical protein
MITAQEDRLWKSKESARWYFFILLLLIFSWKLYIMSLSKIQHTIGLPAAVRKNPPILFVPLTNKGWKDPVEGKKAETIRLDFFILKIPHQDTSASFSDIRTVKRSIWKQLVRNNERCKELKLLKIIWIWSNCIPFLLYSIYDRCYYLNGTLHRKQMRH